MTARLVAVTGELADVEIAGHVVHVPHRGHAVGGVTVAIRPDAVRLNGSEDDGGIKGRILRAAFVGRVLEYTIETAAGELLAIAPGTDAALGAGEQVSLSLSPRGVALVE